jgi:hypothetical protein
MRIRLDTANANRSALLSGEALSRTSADLRYAAQAAIRQKLPLVCDVIVDGGPYQLPIDIIDKEEVATVEVYAGKLARSGAMSIDPRGTAGGARDTDRRGCPGFYIYVWMK